MQDVVLETIRRLQKQRERQERERQERHTAAELPRGAPNGEAGQAELDGIVERFGAPFLLALIFRRAGEEPDTAWERTVKKARPCVAQFPAPWRRIAERLLESGEVFDGLAAILELGEQEKRTVLDALLSGDGGRGRTEAPEPQPSCPRQGPFREAPGGAAT